MTRRRIRDWLTEEVTATEVFAHWRLIVAAAIIYILLNLPLVVMYGLPR
jgi:hypothetical protein